MLWSALGGTPAGGERSQALILGKAPQGGCDKEATPDTSHLVFPIHNLKTHRVLMKGESDLGPRLDSLSSRPWVLGLLVFICLWAAGVQPELEQPSAKQQRERNLLPGLQGFQDNFLQRFRELWSAWQGFLGFSLYFRVIYDSHFIEKVSTCVSTYS